MEKKWWHDKVAYQIYPKSFCDTNGDGIGDLRGIIGKLDYLKKLGIDILWLSPIFCSPLADQGYDISDYYNIDPRFGTMEEMDELIAEAKKRNMYILMDLVVNHCSDEHEWFKKACEDPDGKYGKYFYIEEVKDNKMPTNWRSYFGGSVWEKLPGHENKYYLHLFHKKQPDLNWENPEVREEIYKMINWWLDKGLGGFRIDAIINIKKALPLRDYPVDRDDNMCTVQKMLADAHGIGVFLNEMKERTFKPHDSFTVGEVFDVKKEDIPRFIDDNGYFSTMFDFSTTIIGASEKGWYDRMEVEPEEYIRAIYNSQKQVGDAGFLANIIENHDEPRGVSRYIPQGDCTDKSKKMLALLTLMTKGIPFIYEGQEIGMENMPFSSIDEVDDISTLDEYQVALRAGLSEKDALKAVSRFSRDNARTPMQWDASANAGFTTGTAWLKINPNYTTLNVASQLKDDDSLFHFYRKLIALRKNPEYKDTIVYGEFVPLTNVSGDVMAFYRKGQKKTLLVVGNFKNETDEVMLPGKVKTVLLANDDIKVQDNKIVLRGYQAAVFELA